MEQSLRAEIWCHMRKKDKITNYRRKKNTFDFKPQVLTTSVVVCRRTQQMTKK